jgi:chromosome segregation ATPase
MILFTELVKKYGIVMVLGAVILDDYRRQVINDRVDQKLDQIRSESSVMSEEHKAEFEKAFTVEAKKAEYSASIDRLKTADDNHGEATAKYEKAKNKVNQIQQEITKTNLDKCIEEVQKLDISELFSSLYNKYSEFLDSLTPDKIVCLFNIIIDGLILSSFFSILSIMLSDNIINRIEFLEKYPRILKLLKLRNNINRKVSKFYLLMHLIIIVLGILGNIYMFFI